LNAAFREWLRSYIAQDRAGETYRELMKTLKKVNAGRRFSRDEMNDR
jgi:hypothetical protein